MFFLSERLNNWKIKIPHLYETAVTTPQHYYRDNAFALKSASCQHGTLLSHSKHLQFLKTA